MSKFKLDLEELSGERRRVPSPWDLISTSAKRSFSWVFPFGFLFVLLTGCSKTPSQESEAASYSGGIISIAEVESALRTRIHEGSGPEYWLDQYRREAEALAGERIILGDQEDLSLAFHRELGGTFARLECELISEAYLGAQELSFEPPSEDAVRSYYEDRSDLFDQREQRLTWHLYLREGEEGPQGTKERLLQIRERVLNGEAFRDLAKAYSQSENQSLGGHLGWMERGDLPPKLEEIVFALPTDGVSEPQMTPGGGFLVYVSNILPAVKVTFGEAAPRIRRRLLEIEGRNFVQELAKEDEASEDDVVLTDQALATLFSQEPDDHEILRIGKATLTFGEFRRMVEALGGEAIPVVSPNEQILESYQSLVSRLRICRRAYAGLLAPEELDDLETQAQQMGRAQLVEKRLRDRFAATAESQPDRLRRFFNDNRHLYQGPLRIRVAGLIAEEGDEPADRARFLERLRKELLDPNREMKAIAKDKAWLKAFESSWMGPSALANLEPKVLLYLTQLEIPGLTPVFRVGGKLHLYRVLERQEPVPLAYERVKERVLMDYVARHQQELFGEVLEEMLKEAHFIYYEDRVKNHLESLSDRGESPS